MAMVTKNNVLATMSLGELNKNIVEKGKRMTRLATGQKIVGAGDGASEFSITEKMQVQLRSLGQDIENTRTGRSMLSVGAGGIEKIVEELRGMKQLAINAANDTNTDADRATIQKEFDQKKQDIADIVATTNYNGKILLDGTYARKIHGQKYNSSGSGETDFGPKGANAVPTTSLGPTNEENWPANGVIEYGGAYTIPENYTGTVTIKSVAAAGGVKLSQESSNKLSNVQILVESPISGGGAQLWIDSLNIENTTDKSAIKFAGSENQLTLIGSSMLKVSANDSTSAVVNMGDGLTVNGNGAELTVINKNGGQGAGIGTDSGQQTSGNLTVEDATLNVRGYDGAGIGSGADGGGIGNINISNTTVNATGHWNAAIGSGTGEATAGNINVDQSTISMIYVGDGNDVVGSPFGNVDTCIGSAYSGSSCGNITVSNSIVKSKSQESPAIGAGDSSTCQTITISNTEVDSESADAAGVGSGTGGSTTGDIYIKNASAIKHVSPNGAAIGSGLGGKVGTIYISESSTELLDASEAYTDETHVIPGIGRGRNGEAGSIGGVSGVPDDTEYEIEDFWAEGNPLIIHTGTRANQHLRCYIENLGLDALGLEDAELTTQEKAQKLLGDVNNPTIEGALDKAINYALGEATQIGAYMSRLDQTKATLTTNQENTTSAESTIRDADMAQEMTAMVKSNILSQSSQAMLAQANQIGSNVLDLLG